MSNMSFAIFIEEAIKTESHDTVLNDEIFNRVISYRLVHSILGLNTEYFEFINSKDSINALEELGDMLWYLAIIFDVFDVKNINDADIVMHGKDELINTIFITIGEHTDNLKKTLYYNREFPYKKFLSDMFILYKAINEYILLLDSKPAIVREAIINKLRVRYPDKFKSENANNRDLYREREILEKMR